MMMMTLRGSAGSGVPPRRALEWARAPSPYPARPAGGRTASPEKLFEKKERMQKKVSSAALYRDRPVPPFLPIVQRSAPTDTGAARPPGFFCAENPNRLTCFSQRPARGAVVRRSPAFMTLEREATPTAYFLWRSRPGVTKKPPYAVVAIRRVCSPPFL